METAGNKKFRRMTREPVERLVCKMAVPSIISMLVSAFYNMADTFFVGKISTQATAAVGVVFSYMALIQAVGFFFGHGSGNFISRALGQQRREGAEKMAAVGFFSAFFWGCMLVLPGFLLMRPILQTLGATETILPEAQNYFRYILIATPFLMSSLVLNNQMRLQGNANKSMFGILTGALLNVALDPVFIFGFGMGAGGAALATAISQFIGFCVLLVMCEKSDGIKIRFRAFHPSWESYREIAAGGLPSLCRQGLASVAAMSLNRYAGGYGDSAIAAFSVVNRVTMIASSALLGFGQGFQPVCGFNYGAKLYGRVKKAFWFCVKVAAAALVGISVFGFAFAEGIITLFRAEDAQVIAIGAKALRFQCLAFPLMSWVIIVNMFLQNTRKTLRATILAMSRQGIAFLPALFLLAHFFGLSGIQMAQPVADVLTFVLAVPFGLSALGEMKEETRQEAG